MIQDETIMNGEIQINNPKYLATFQRQQYINVLEKIMKNMFRMFRRDDTTPEQLEKRFGILNKKRKTFTGTYLDSEYHRAMEAYCNTIERLITGSYNFETIRDEQMTQLNRIQKLKNAKRYKKEKYKKNRENNLSKE